ncbi:MAG: GTPase HflX [Thermoanaerobacterales bacterium 50_218]|nr:MAG: GTPase HflX [Thermoanaerobacterales bacterium 50_218]HAA90580.1 GTPase HflX [Peptococcaceae bacterium]
MKKGIICYLATREDQEEINYDLAELRELLRNIGIEVCEVVVQRRRPNLLYLFGEGKIREVRELVKKEGIEAVVFNLELSPRQVRALEDLFGEGVEVWDRTQVILEIFRHRARSREGKIQVELARLSYLYPRILGLGGVLSRLGGGIGTRGPGETKLEVLRRAVRRRIHDLKEELAEVRKNRELLRKHRKEEGLPVVSLVGYTNAGKSTLLNALCRPKEKVLVEDRLFATLDPVSRRLRLPSGRIALLTDTVGFVKDLPQKLKAAFMATLEELLEADLLLHVIDLASPCLDRQIEAVEEILEEMKLYDRPIIKVYNKIDAYEGPLPADGLAVSALYGTNLDSLLTAVDEKLFREQEATLVLPYQHMGEFSRFREHLEVVEEQYLPEGVHLRVRGRSAELQRFLKRVEEKKQKKTLYVNRLV